MDPNALPAHFQIDYIRAYSVDPTAKAVALQPLSSPDGVNTAPVLAVTNTVGSGADTLLLRLSEDAYQGHAQFTIKVDGVQVGSVQTVAAAHAAGQTETLAVRGDWGLGNHTVSVTFLNDLQNSAGGDRNLYLEGAIYNGATIVEGEPGQIAPVHQFVVQDMTAAPGTLSVADVAATEGDYGTTALTFVVNLSQTSSTPVTVRWDALAGTATAGADFEVTAGLLTFAPGQTSAGVTVSLRGDTTWEPDETFRLVLSTPTGATLARAEAVGTIRNDDAVPTLSVADAGAAEGNSGSTGLSFAVSLSQASSAPVTVRWDALAGTAAPGADFATTGGLLTFAPGQTTANVAVSLLGDTTYEPDETFRLVLSAPTGATLARPEAVGTIRNDDAVPTLSVADAGAAEGNSGSTALSFAVSLSQASSTPVTVRWDALAGTAVPGADFTAPGGLLTFAPGQTTANVAVNLLGDTVYEPDETFRLVLSTPTGATLAREEAVGTIRNDDAVPTLSVADAGAAEGNSGSTALSFAVSLSQASSTPVTVRWDALAGTAVPGADFTAPGGLLTFAPGQTTTNVAVNLLGDTTWEPEETFRLVLSAPTGATLARADAVGTIRNDDAVPTLSVADAGAAEGNSGSTALSFAVTLSEASSAPVTVHWDALAGTAAPGADFATAGGLLTFAPGQTIANVAVNLLGDTVWEPNETFRLMLSAPTGATLARADAVGTIRNDDAGLPPDEVVNDGSGIDTARLAIGFRGSSVETSGGLPSHVTGGGRGYITTGMEVLQFVDGRLVFDPADPAAQVVRLYNAALARSPDQDGLNYYIDQVEHGRGLADIALGFNTSPEFQSRFGAGLSNDQYVVQLYQNVLHRGAAESELGYYRDQFAAGQSREQTLVNFSESPENKALTAATVQAGIWDVSENAAEVARLYDTLLGRKPDMAGLVFYREQLDAGQFTPQNIVQNFTGSPEFQARYGTDLPSAQFVELLYQNTLHRAGSAEEVQYYATQLDAGTLSRAGAVINFSDSPEHIALTAPDIMSENPAQFGIAFA
ncbi:Calx-beta domain-containing protein [Roseomonas sp. BN140053]|uniref:Calx-beta domain-containing protein n=1 Tax=Roseomonas sp. BN140053 TaxID=3391898 RepID=UPI0039EBD56E